MRIKPIRVAISPKLNIKPFISSLTYSSKPGQLNKFVFASFYPFKVVPIKVPRHFILACPP